MPRPSLPEPPPASQTQVPRPGARAWNFGGLERLPSPFNHGWERLVPPEIRRQMLAHDKVSQAINLLKAAILGEGGRVVPAVHPAHPDWERAQEIAALCHHALRHLRGSWHAIARQLLDCTSQGHKLGPVAWRAETRGRYKGYWLLDSIEVWPARGYAFLANSAGQIEQIEVADPRAPGGTRRYARERFVLLSWRPVDGDPFGTDALLPAYEPFYRDVQLDPEEMAMFAQFGRPTVVVIAPGRGSDGLYPPDVPVFEADGVTPLLSSNGQPVRLPVTQDIARKMDGYEAGSILVLPGDSQFHLAEAQNGGEAFRAARDQNARRIIATILGTHQVTEAEKQMSTSNTAAGEGALSLGVTDGKRALEEMVENDLFVPLVLFNFGEGALDLLPVFDLGSGYNGRLVGLMNAVSGYLNNGAFDQTQWWQYCLQVGLPLPDPAAAPVVTQTRATGGAHGNTAPDKEEENEE